MPDSPSDTWAVGEAYERYVGRWSRLVAPKFVDWLGIAGGKRWLEVGCGTGALTRTILDRAAPAKIVAVDPSEGFLAHARAHVTDPRTEFRQGGGEALPVGDGEFHAVVSGLVLNFIPDQPKAVGEFSRAVATGATVAAYVWDYAEGMELMRHFWDAAVALDPGAAKLDEGTRFPACRPEPLKTLFTATGFTDVIVEAIEVPTVFRDFDDYWSPFLGAQGPAPTYCMNLPEPARNALRDRIRGALPVALDGSIPLTARAWAVRGRK